MCNISMGGKICRLHDGIKTTRLHDLINHNTDLSNPCLQRLIHYSFQTCRKLSESQLLTTIYVKYQLISKRNYKYILSKKVKSKMSEF